MCAVIKQDTYLLQHTPTLAPDRSFRHDLAESLTGFFSAFLAVAIVPRVVGLFVRRFAVKLVLEALAFAAMGLLFERAARLTGKAPRRKQSVAR